MSKSDIMVDSDPYGHQLEDTVLRGAVRSVRISHPDKPDGWIEVTLAAEGWFTIRAIAPLSVRPNVSNDISIKVEHR